MAVAIDGLLWWACLASSGACACLGTATLLLRKPARGRLLFDGYRRARRDREAAIFLKERAPMPSLVEDGVAFTDGEGVERRVTLLRRAVDHDRTLLVWYDPGRPERASAIGPHHWYGLMLALSGTYALPRLR